MHVAAGGQLLTINFSGRRIPYIHAIAMLNRQPWVSEASYTMSESPRRCWLNVKLAEPATIDNMRVQVNEALGYRWENLPQARPADVPAEIPKGTPTEGHSEDAWQPPSLEARIISGLTCAAAINAHEWTELDIRRFMRGLGQLNWIVSDSIDYFKEGQLITFTYDWPAKRFDSKFDAESIEMLICIGLRFEFTILDDEQEAVAA
jgi:hypothetical protein